MLMMLIIISNHNNWCEPKCGHSVLSNYIFGYLHPRIPSMLKWIQIWICHTGIVIIIIIILVCHAYESKVVCPAHESKVAMSWPLTMSLSGPLWASKRLNCYSTYIYQATFINIALYILCGRLASNFHLSSASNSKCSFANIFDLMNSFKPNGLWENISNVLNIIFTLFANIGVLTFILFKHALVNATMPEG